MNEPTPGERAMVAERAWSAAKQAGDTRLQAAALAEYRDAWRAIRQARAVVSGPSLAGAAAQTASRPT